MAKISTVFLACVAAVSCGAASAQTIVTTDLTRAAQSISSTGDRRVELGAANLNGLGGLNLKASSGAVVAALQQSVTPDVGTAFKMREALGASTNPMLAAFPSGLNHATLSAAIGSGGADAAPPVQLLIGIGGGTASMASALASEPAGTPVKIGK